MMDPELMQQLRVDDPMEEPELNLDGLEISSIQVLLEPPALDEDDTDIAEDNFYSPLDHFQNLVKLSMSNAQCQNLEAFPHLPLLRSLMLADNNLSKGFEALAEADLQNLVRLDLSGNKISDLEVLRPLVALGNLQHLMLSENEAAQKDYRDAVFEILPQLITVDGLDRDGTEIDVDDDVTILSGDEEGHDNEDAGSQSDSDLEDQENRPPAAAGKGKTVGIPVRVDDDEEDDDELEEEDEEDEDDEDEYEGEGGNIQQHQRGPASDEEEDDDDEVDDEEEEDEEDEEEEEEEGGDGPGLEYLLSDNIQDDNDEEFEPTNEADDVSEMESSDEDEGGPQSSAAAGSTNTNGHRSKRQRSPSSTTAPAEFDQPGGGFDVDGEDDDTTNGFGMASFDGPATFDDETTHEAKRPRT